MALAKTVRTVVIVAEMKVFLKYLKKSRVFHALLKFSNVACFGNIVNGYENNSFPGLSELSKNQRIGKR